MGGRVDGNGGGDGHASSQASLVVGDAAARRSWSSGIHPSARRVLKLRRFTKWLKARYDLAFPTDVLHITSFLEDLHHQGVTQGQLRANMREIAFFELVAGVEIQIQNQLTKKSVLKGFMEELVVRAQPTVLRGSAPRPFVVLLSALEKFVVDIGQKPFYRAHAWWKLLQTWGVLRHQDHLGFRPYDPEFFFLENGALRATLTKTKTVGRDKKIKHKPVYISSPAWILEPHWLTVGWNVLHDLAPDRRHFLMPRPAMRGMRATCRELSHKAASLATAKVFASMKDPFHRGILPRGKLLADVVVKYWAEHSMLSFLSTAASCLSGCCSIQRR